MPTSADRNLLFGILALQMDFITRDQLIAGMNAWVLAKHRPIGEILVEQQALASTKRSLLEPLVDQHVRDHGGEAHQSLSALSSVSDLFRRIGSIDDPDLHASLSAARASSADATADLPHETGGRYRVLRPHARGGLGEVFVAEDMELHRPVALKEIQERHAHDVGSKARFILEAEITGQLEHPGIVPVYGLGAHADGRPFYAMRFIKGDNLGEAIKRFHNGPHGLSARTYDSLDFRRLLQRFIDVCNAVAYAHSRGVLHRDLKPGNVMLGEYGETLLVDWGLAKVVGRPDQAEGETVRPSSGSGSVETQAGSAIGTPAFMSPEQAEGKLNLLGPTTDVYSLGATLYMLLTGRPPVEKGELADMLERVRRGDFPAPCSVQPGVPIALDAVCRKAMALAPSQRYESAQALAADVEHWLADEPVGAFAEPVAMRTRRWVRKHPGPVTGIAVSLVVGALGLGGGLYFVNAERVRTELARQGEERQKSEAQRQRDEADRQRTNAQRRSEQIEKGSDLLAAIFNDLNPQNREKDAESIQVILGKRLQAAAQQIDGESVGDPLIVAHLQSRIGVALKELGFVAEAVELLERSLAIRERMLAPNDTVLLFHRSILGAAYENAGHLKKALAVYENSVRDCALVFGADHPNTESARSNLARVYLALGQQEKAIPVFRDQLAAVETKYGRDHLETVIPRNNVAVTHGPNYDVEEVIRLLETNVRILESHLGQDHVKTLSAMHNLAHFYWKAGRHQATIDLYVLTLGRRSAVVGLDHADTLSTRNDLALAYFQLGETEKAIPQLEEVLKRGETRLGIDHPIVNKARHNLSTCYGMSGQPERAIPLCELTVKFNADKLGADHPFSLSSRANLAALYAKAGQTAKAIELFDETIRKMEVVNGAADERTLGCRQNLGHAYQNAGNWEKARELLETNVRVCEANLGPDNPVTMECMLYLGAFLTDAGRQKESLAILDEVLLRQTKAQSSQADQATTLFAIARAHALGAKDGPDKDRAGEAAVGWLQKAVFAGYKYLPRLNADRVLDPLRHRDDFKKLVADVEAKVAAEKKAADERKSVSPTPPRP